MYPYDETPNEDPGILRKILRGTLGGIGYVGSTLDKPGAAVRGLLAGHPGQLANLIPFSDSLGITDPTTDRTSGRDLLESWGALDHKQPDEGFGAGDVAGFGAELATDPFLYFSHFGRALTTAGKLAESAGVLKKVDQSLAYANRGLSNAERVGTGINRMKTTLGDAVSLLPGADRAEAVNRITQKATALGIPDWTQHVDEPLGAAMQFGLPFGQKTALGSDPAGWGGYLTKPIDRAATALMYGRPLAAVASGIEKIPFVGKTLAGTAPVQALAQSEFSPGMMGLNLFHAPNMEAADRTAAEFNPAAHDARLQGRAKAEAEFYGHARNIEQAAAPFLEDKDLFSRIGEHVEGDPAQWLATHGQDIQGELLRLGNGDVADGEKRFLAYANAVQAGQVGMERARLAYNQLGGDVGDLAGGLGYLPRSLTEGAMMNPAGLAKTKPTSASHAAQNARLEYLQGIGSADIRAMTQDPLIATAKGAGDLKGLEAGVEAYGNRVNPWTGKPIVPGSYTVADAANGIVTKDDQVKQVANLFGSIPKEVFDSGIFGNHPLADMRNYFGRMGESIAGAQNAAEYMGRVPEAIFDPVAATTRAELRAQGQTVPAVLQKIGLKLGDVNEGMGQAILRAQGLPVTEDALNALKKFRVNDADAGTIAKQLQPYKIPEPAGKAMGIYDAFTNLFKGWATIGRLNFGLRARGSGTLETMLGRAFSPAAQSAAADLLRGKTVEGASEIPELRRLLVGAGRPVDDAEATRLLSESSAAHGVGFGTSNVPSSVQQGTGAMTAAQGLRPASAASVLGELPDADPYRFGKVMEDFKGNYPGATFDPFAARGFAGHEETNNRILRGLERFTDYNENLVRHTAFVSALKKGEPVSRAAEIARNIFPDYSSPHWTNFERGFAQKVAPFWKFSKATAVNTARQLLAEPGGPKAQFIRALSDMHNPDVALPDYIGGGLSIPIPEGTPFIGPEPGGDPRYLTSGGLYMEDPASFLGEGTKGAINEVLSRTNPLIKGAIEYGTNQSFFQRGPFGGRPLEDLDPTLGRTLSNVQEMLGAPPQRQPVQLGTAFEHVLANSPLSAQLNEVRTLTDPRKNILAKAVNLLSGVKLSDVSQQARDAGVQHEAQRLTKELGGREFAEVYFPKELVAQTLAADPQLGQEMLALNEIRSQNEKKAKLNTRLRKMQPVAQPQAQPPWSFGL